MFVVEHEFCVLRLKSCIFIKIKNLLTSVINALNARKNIFKKTYKRETIRILPIFLRKY